CALVARRAGGRPRARGRRGRADVLGRGGDGRADLARARERGHRDRSAHPRVCVARAAVLRADRAAGAGGRVTGALVAFRWETRKLLAQKRTYIGIGAAALLPTLFVVVMSLQTGGPYDAPLRHNLRKTGLSLALVVLTVASRFGAQLVTALVAGDIVASEDSGGTLKTILTRSLVRGQILAGKALATLAYVVAILVSLAVAGIIGGTI